MLTLFESVLRQQSDMQGHVQRLKDLASECETAVEFGVRSGVSTIALLAGGVELISYDTDPCTATVEHLKDQLFTFVQRSSLECTIPECDLLFIDTRHTGLHLKQELVRHQGRVRKYIAMHDTEEFGSRGDDGGMGMKIALFDFLAEYPRWRIKEHHRHSYGLTVLSS